MGVVINLYTGNHRHIWGISDYVDMIRRSFLYANLSIEFHVSDQIRPNVINIILEEFSETQTVDYFKKIKKSDPSTKLWLFLTEVPNAGSYNLFSWSRKCKTQFVKVADKIFKLTESGSAYDLYFPRGISTLSNETVSSRIIRKSKKGFNKLASVVNRVAHNERYFYHRYVNTIENWNLFDEHFVIHDKVIPFFEGLDVKYFYYAIPSIDWNIQSRPYWCYFSGTLTKYRKNLLLGKFKAIQDKILIQAEVNDVIRDNYLSQSYFSIALPRYEEWRFSSPTRTISSLRYGSLPLEVVPSIWDEFEEPIFLDFQTLLDKIDDISGLYNAQVELVQNARATRNKQSFHFIHQLLDRYI